MVVHRPEPVCHALELGWYLQGQGQNKDLYNHNMTVSTISFEQIFLFATKLSLLVDKAYSENVLVLCKRSKSH